MKIIVLKILVILYIHPGSALDLYGTTSLFSDVLYLTYTAFVSVIFYIGVDIDYDPVIDPVHYGVVYAYVYANDVLQLLLYNIQGLNPYDNNERNNMNQYNSGKNDVVCNNSTQDVNVNRPVCIYDVHDCYDNDVVWGNGDYVNK